MEFWCLLLAIFGLCASVIISLLLNLIHGKKLPPGPASIPMIGNFLWLLKASRNFSAIEPVIRQLRAQYGSIVTLRIGTLPSIIVTTREAAHRVLVQNGSLFAHRPMALETTRVLFNDQRTISTAPCGPLWRLLRQNFLSVTHPSRLHLYADGRKWALDVLKKRLLSTAAEETGNPIAVADHFRHAVFCLLVYMCFGEKFDENIIEEIDRSQRATVTNFIKFNLLNFMPRLGKIVFRDCWNELVDIRRKQENVLAPLIRARQEKKQKLNSLAVEGDGHPQCAASSYIDSLLDLQLPPDEDRRNFSEDELVSLCSEFFKGGTDTSASTLQWVMANLVKHQDIQEKLVKEINSVVKAGAAITEQDLKRMPYLKAVVLETLRRHPPGHFMLPRAVKEDIKFDGYDIPKNVMVNFAVAVMAWDPNVWEDPMEFRPERFLVRDHHGVNKETVEFDLRGVKEIKMMPFGAGRRVCPAIEVALLHQQYFVANLVRDFRWVAGNGCDVDLSVKQDFTLALKNPLCVHAYPRISS